METNLSSDQSGFGERAAVQPWRLSAGEDVVFAGEELEVALMERDEVAAVPEVERLLAQFDRELAAKRAADGRRARRRDERVVLRRFPRRPVAEWLGEEPGEGMAA